MTSHFPPTPASIVAVGDVPDVALDNLLAIHWIRVADELNLDSGPPRRLQRQVVVPNVSVLLQPLESLLGYLSIHKRADLPQPLPLDFAVRIPQQVKDERIRIRDLARLSVKEKDPVRCWQFVGTYCGGKVQGQFTEEYAACRACPTFVEACPTLVEELGEHLNNTLFLLRAQKQRVQEAMARVEHLNKELTSAVENLDARNREIQEIMTTDRLTGLYNRNYLFKMLEDEFARAGRRSEYRFSLLMIDIDDFKSVNDTYGHGNGDKMLSRFGLLLKEGIRKFDRAFRYGGEEFVVVLPDTELAVARLVGERIRSACEKETFAFLATGKDKPTEVSRTLSLGAVAPSPETTAEILLAQADEAMYAAKTQGKNRVVAFGDFHDA